MLKKHAGLKKVDLNHLIFCGHYIVYLNKHSPQRAVNIIVFRDSSERFFQLNCCTVFMSLSLCSK